VTEPSGVIPKTTVELELGAQLARNRRPDPGDRRCMTLQRGQGVSVQGMLAPTAARRVSRGAQSGTGEIDVPHACIRMFPLDKTCVTPGLRHAVLRPARQAQA
jgi:hypothetical protein